MNTNIQTFELLCLQFANRLKMVMKLRGISKEYLSVQSAISMDTVQDILDARHNLLLSEMQKIEEVIHFKIIGFPYYAYSRPLNQTDH